MRQYNVFDNISFSSIEQDRLKLQKQIIKLLIVFVLIVFICLVVYLKKKML